MSEISNEISYLKGLAEGMSISDKSEEGKLIGKLIDVLSNAAEEIDALWARNNELESRLEEIDEDVFAANMDIEELYGILDEDEDEEFWDDDNSGFWSDDEDDEYDDEDDDDLFDMYDDEDDGLFEILCPECGEDVMVDFEMLDDENNIVCPNCHQEIELEFDVEDDEADDEE